MSTLNLRTYFGLVLVSFLTVQASFAQAKLRARDLGIPFEGSPGPLNAITDVQGVEVGHVTLISGKGKLVVGKGPVRTGVTAILSRGRNSSDPVFAAWFALNGNGEMTGTTWVEESGFLEGPVMITNTHSVGTVRDAVIAWQRSRGTTFQPWMLPVVAETYDGFLNDINGFHVKEEHVFQALDGAKAGPVGEGSVGGGTGMVAHGFKGGIGTSSRILDEGRGGYTVGVLVQCNYNWGGDNLRLGGMAVSELLPVGRHCFTDRSIERHLNWYPYCDEDEQDARSQPARDGSIIIVVATDAPLLPHQLRRLAKRPSLALGRLGAVSNSTSGDIFIAFSTANARRIDEDQFSDVGMYPNNGLSSVFEAAIQATEEALVNAMVAAETVVGASGLRVDELPDEQVRAIFLRGEN